MVTDSPDDYHTANGARDAFWQVRKEDEEHQVEEAVARQNAEREKRTAQQNSDTRKRSRDVRDSAMVQQHPPESPSQNITTPVITNVQSTPHAARTSRKRRRERIENQVLTNENVEEPPQKNPRLGIFAWLSQTFKALFLPFRQNPPPIQYPPAPAPAPPPLPQALPSKPMGASPNLASSSHTDKKSLLDTQIRHQARMNTLVLTAAAARPDEKVEDSDVKPFVGLPLPRDISLDRLALRQAVFSDLHDKGYFLSCGAKFGADFLAYPGSPQIFHGSLAVIAVMADEVVGARDVVSLGRLGDSTKKRTILAFLGNSSTVQYVGIQWEETLP